MLENVLIPQFDDDDHERGINFQQDLTKVRDFLNDRLADTWIGQGGHPVHRISYFSIFYFWGFIKKKIHKLLLPAFLAELGTRIYASVE